MLSMLQSIDMRSQQIAQLTEILVESCVNQTEEQNELAKELDQLMTKAAMTSPMTYEFLSSPKTKFRTSPKKNTPKLVRSRHNSVGTALQPSTPVSKAKIIKKAKKPTSPKRRLSSTDEPRFYAETFSAPTSPSTSGILLHENLINIPSTSHSPPKKIIEFVEEKKVDKVAQILKAIEMSSDDFTVMVLCKLLEGYVTVGTKAVRQRRLRHMIRIDAATYFFRCIKANCHIPEPSPFKVIANDQLMTTVIRICVKDTKFLLKIRISGLLNDLCARILEVDRIFCTIALMKFTCRALKSPRNAQELGRDRQFAQRFTNILGNFNAIECASSQFGANDVQIDTPDGLARSQNPEAFTAADKMARLVEILFYVTKNRKNKLHLVDQGIVEVVKNIFESHFNRRFVDSVHSEIALISTAVIRHLSKTKKGKEELTRLNVLQMCEECIQKLSDDRVQLASRKNLLANCTQLQDSLCALAIRCLPQLTFPITSQKFPLAFPVPQEGQNVLKSEAKNECQNEDGMDSDDEDGIDEEEDSFLNFMKDPKPPTNENSNGADDEMIAFQSDDEDSNQKMEVSDEKLPKFSKQKLAGLKANYSKIFLELEQGASASNVPSPKLRRTNEGAVPSVPEAQSQEKKPDYKESIIRLAEETKSVANFIKIAYPELVNPDIETNRNDLLANQDSMRETVMQKLTKLRQQSNEANKPNVVFDLDELHSKPTAKMPLSNNDAEKVGKLDPSTKNLKFESRFESGNLRQAIQVSENHYELVLSPDINEMRSHYQWFYFEVSNNQANVPYTFEVINCLKNTSMFSKGMQPVMFSVAEAQQGRPGWVRCGQAVCYYRNLYVPPTNGSSSSGSETEKTTTRRRTLSENNKKGKECDKENKSYFSIRFSIRFRHAADVCYIAYHFPYTYSYLQATLERHLSEVNSNSIYVRSDRLTTTLAGNPVNILTITAPAEPEVLKQRKFVVFTSRVHPGESNASWTMHGILKKLMAPEAQVLREKFVFKIVPMLNPDGVINGSHRCSLAGVDLNRCWDNPTEHKHPTIYHAKGVLQYMVDVLKKTPLCFVDLHGHSRKSNVFCYGNNPEESWRKADRLMPQHQFQTLPELLDKHADGFSLKDCRYSITKAKESSARIALWRQFGLDRCYTMESTYCGFDQGPLQSKQIGIQDLKKMGQHLCEVLVELEDVVKRNSLPVGQKGKEMRTPLAVNKVAPQLSTPNSSTSLDQDPVRGFRSKRTSISNGTISQNSSKKSLAKQWKSTQQ